MSSTERAPFEPRKHLRTFTRRQRQPDGSYKTVENDYLDVKWRIVWLRDVDPEASIITELLSVPGASPAVVRAVVTMSNGVEATGLGQIDADDWKDYLEKAETRAIGRALGLLGFGTQFTNDFDEAEGGGAPEQSAPQQSSRPQQQRRSGGGPQPMTSNQQNYIQRLGANLGLADHKLDQIAEDRFSLADWSQLNKQQASQLIQHLKAIEAGEAEPPADAAPAPQESSAAPADEGVTSQQLSVIVKLAEQQQMDDNALIAYAGHLSERQITSIAELTEHEAGRLIKALQDL